MPNNEELIKKEGEIKEIADKGKAIYEKKKIEYEPANNGKFLAIEVDSEEVFLGNTAAEALELARKKYQNKIFYVVKIGSDAAETLARTF